MKNFGPIAMIAAAVLFLANNGKPAPQPPIPDEVIENATILEALQLMSERLTEYEQRDAEREAYLQQVSQDLVSTGESYKLLQQQLEEAKAELAIAQTAATEPETINRYYTQDELGRLASQHARSRPIGSDGLHIPSATVDPPNQVWNHLKNDHGFTAAQIDGMSYNDALWLHSGAHDGVITPTTSGEVLADVTTPGIGFWKGADGLYHWKGGDGKTWTSRCMPEEGKVFDSGSGTLFVYENRQMRETSQPTRNRRIQTQNYQSCPNGQCYRRW